MKILAVESSCDETAAAVVENGRTVLSSIIASQVEEHALYGGVVPEIASRRHAEAISAITARALEEANYSLSDMDALAVTAAPGLIGALLVGVNFVKGLALSASKPLIPVHHIRGHIAANYLAFPQLAPPFLCLVVSGGHSHIIEVRDYTQLRVIGRTVDDAAGEAFDKAARAMGLGYPGGVYLDRLAQTGDLHAYKLPRPKVDGSVYDMSFSGLKTAVINLLHTARQRGEEVDIPGLCASFQHTVCEILTQRTVAAAKELGHTTVAIAGGVAANSGLRATLSAACEEESLRLFIPPLSLCGDNAAMIGAQAYFEALQNNFASLSLNGYASMEVQLSFAEYDSIAARR